MPVPTSPDDPNLDEIAEQQHDWQITFENWLNERISYYFPETYPDADKILIQHSYIYNDMLNEWINNPFDETPVTNYVKWHVSL